jgi:hypothetical protein
MFSLIPRDVLRRRDSVECSSSETRNDFWKFIGSVLVLILFLGPIALYTFVQPCTDTDLPNNMTLNNNESLNSNISGTGVNKCKVQYHLSYNTRLSLCTVEGRAIVDVRVFINNRATIKGIALSVKEWGKLVKIARRVQRGLII